MADLNHRSLACGRTAVIAGMSDLPETRFARNGDVHLAYQVFGGLSAASR